MYLVSNQVKCPFYVGELERLVTIHETGFWKFHRKEKEMLPYPCICGKRFLFEMAAHAYFFGSKCILQDFESDFESHPLCCLSTLDHENRNKNVSLHANQTKINNISKLCLEQCKTRAKNYTENIVDCARIF